MDHIYETHTNCEIVHCAICHGGLAYCTVCWGAEGELLPTCPGYRLTQAAHDLAYEGVIKTVDDLKPEHRA